MLMHVRTVITAATFKKRSNILEEFFILKDNDICCKREKCLFFPEQIVYLGCKMSAAG